MMHGRLVLRLALLAMAATLAGALCTANQPPNDTYIPLQNCMAYYQMALGLGQPPQYSTFLVDTGSHTLWVPSALCSCGTTYNESMSSTFVSTGLPGNVKYEDGTTINGFYGTEKVTINGTPVASTSCPILFVTSQKSHGMGSNGIAGFGVSDTTFLDRAFYQGNIRTRNFIVQLQSYDKQSAMYYNRLPPDILQRTLYLPLTSGTLWLVDCLGARVGDQDYTSHAGADMLVDSGTTLLILNQALMDAVLQKSFPFCTYNSVLGSWTCPQSFKLPVITFLSRGLELQIHPETYAVTSDGMNILQITGGSRTILGMVFFRNYNITFDKERKKVGFDGPLSTLTRIGSDFLFWSIVAMIALFASCFLLLLGLRCVNNYKVKQR